MKSFIKLCSLVFLLPISIYTGDLTELPDNMTAGSQYQLPVNDRVTTEESNEDY